MPDTATVTVATAERPAAPPRQTPHRRAAVALIVALSVHASIAAAMWPLIQSLPEATPSLTPITVLIDQITTVAGATPTAPHHPADTPPVPSEKAEVDDTRQHAVPSLAALNAPAPMAGTPAPEPAPAKSSLDTPPPPPPARPAETKQPAPAARRAAAAPPPAPAAAPRPRSTAGKQNDSQGTNARRSATSYPALVAAHLQRYHSYPREAQANGAAGVVRVSFQLDRAGRVRSVALSQQSGSAMLNAAALSAVRRASPFPAPPPDAGALNFQVPLRFVMR
jgi:protein TonB